MNSNSTDPKKGLTWTTAQLMPAVTARSDGAAMSGSRQNIDYTTGAPANVRAAMAGVRGMASKLNTLRKFYPDARVDGEGGFLFTDSRRLPNGQTERVTVAFDEAQPTARDIIDGVPVLGELAGAIYGGAKGGAVGAATGTPLGPVGVGVGGVVGGMAGAGTGAVAGREIISRAMSGLFGGEDVRSTGEQVKDARGTFTANALGEGAARGVIGAARGVGGIGRALGSAPDRSGREVIGAGEFLGGTKPQGRVARAMGLDPVPVIETPRVLSSRGKIIQFVQAVTKNLPGPGNVIASGAQRFRDQVGKAATDMTATMAGGQSVGKYPFLRTLRDAADGVQARFDAQREALEGVYVQEMGQIPDGRVPVPRSTALLADIEQRIARSPNSVAPDYKEAIGYLRRVIDDAEGEIVTTPSPVLGADGMPAAVTSTVVRPEGIPFDVLRNMRTEVGRITNFNSPLTLKPKGELMLQEVYGAFKDDIAAAAKKADIQGGHVGGGGPAEKALAAYDEFVHLARTHEALANIDTFAKITDTMGDVPPVQWALRMSREQYGAARIKDTLAHFTPAEREGLAASIFHDAGTRVTASGREVWDLAKFNQSMRDMGPEVQNAIWGHTEFRQILPQINAMARISEEGANLNAIADSKPSGLIGLAVGGGTVGVGASHPVAAALTALGSLTAAGLVANPRFLRWMTSAVKAGTWTAAQGARLAVIKRSEPKLRDAIEEYENALREAGVPFPDPTLTQHLNQSPGTSYQPR